MSVGGIQVCIECKHPRKIQHWRGVSGGEALMTQLQQSAALAALRGPEGTAAFTPRPVACLGNCKQRCRLSVSGDGRWSWLLGQLQPGKEEDLLVGFLRAWLAADKGLISKNQRSDWLKDKALGRVPPLLPAKEQQRREITAS